MNVSKTITFKMADLSIIGELVDNGEYKSISEFVQKAIREKILKRKLGDD